MLESISKIFSSFPSKAPTNPVPNLRKSNLPEKGRKKAKEEIVTQKLKKLLGDAKVFIDETIDMEKHSNMTVQELKRSYCINTFYNKHHGFTDDYVKVLKDVATTVKDIISVIERPLKELDTQLSKNDKALITDFYDNAIKLMLDKFQNEASACKTDADKILICSARAKAIHELSKNSGIELSNKQQKILSKGIDTSISYAIAKILNNDKPFGFLPEITTCISEMRGENITQKEQQQINKILSKYIDCHLEQYNVSGYYELTLDQSSLHALEGALKAKQKYNIPLSQEQKEKVIMIANIGSQATKDEEITKKISETAKKILEEE